MTIKVKDASQREAVPASPAQIAEMQVDLGIVTTEAAQALIDAKSSLGAMSTAVQTVVDSASVIDRARGNHTGVDPATNVSVIIPGGSTTDLQTYINALELRLTTLGSTAPANTVQPTAPTGTLTVGSTLTAVTGTWTGASTYNYVWFRVHASTGVFTATGGVAATYVLQAADAGYKMAVSVAGVSATNVIAAPVISAVTSAVGVTLPTISVAPAVTPSGSQAVGVTLTSTTGTWNNASGAVYTYQWTLDDAAISGATSSTYTLITGQEGKAVVCRVLATTAQGPAASTAASNTITVASSPVLTNSATPSFTGTVTEGSPNTIILGTWSQTVDASRTWRIYIAAGSGGLVTPYATITGTTGTYTPLNDSFYQTQTGLSVIAGQSVYVDETVTYLGVPYTSAKSTVKVIAAISATLATTTDNTGLSWTASSAITAVKPVSATGGTLPYSYAITPSTTALPTGLTINSSTGLITGTPSASGSLTTYSITVTDAVGATSTKTFTATVSAASATALAYINSPGYGIEAPNDADTNSYAEKNYSNGASIPPLSNLATITRGGVVRFSPSSDGGTPTVQHRIVQGDPTRNSGARCEYTFEDFRFANGEDIWFGAAYLLGSDCNLDTMGGSNEVLGIQQTHQRNTSTTNPINIQLYGATSVSTRYSRGLNWIVNSGGNDIPIYVWSTPPVGTWFRTIMHYRSGFASAGNAPILEVWVASGTGSYTKLTARTDFSAAGANTDFGEPLSTPGSNNDYAKIGFYKPQTASWGSSSTRSMQTSGLYAEKGVSLFNQTAQALIPWAK